jgi:GNAT superfamily N-acetyltransferase
LIIRQMDYHDINQLIQMRYDFTAEYKELEAGLFEAFSEECRAFFEEMLHSNRWVAWVADVDGRIVSHIFVQIIDTIPRPGRDKSPYGYVTNVYTIPEYRSKGIGSKIIREVKQWAKSNGLTFLMVWPSEASVEFYERFGFRHAKEVMENHFDDFE